MRNGKGNPYAAAGLTAFCVIAASLLVFFLLFNARGAVKLVQSVALILRPIFMGAVLAFLLLPVHRFFLRMMLRITPDSWLQRRRLAGLPNFAAIALSLITAFLTVYVLLALVVPQVWQSAVDLVRAVPVYAEQAQAGLQTFFDDNPDLQAAMMPAYDSSVAALEQWLNSEILPNMQSAPTLTGWLRSEMLPNLTGVVSGVSNVLFATLALVKDIVIAVIVSVYLLARKDVFAAQTKKIVYSLLRTDLADLAVNETRNAYRIMSGFINGKLLDSLIIGVICLVCCNLFRFPYPALISTIIGVTNIIPFFGPFIGAIPCIFLIFIIDPLQSVYFALFVLVLQQFDGNILGPKILGDSTGLASFWVLFSIILFGGLFGFAGMVLGVPVFAMLYSVVERLVRRGLRRRQLPEDTRAYIGKTPPFSRP